MDANQETDATQLDKLGAHFKFRDMCTRLRTVEAQRLQEKRSSDLLAYQAYFTQNEQPLQIKIQQSAKA